jgi:regulatory protein
MAFGAPSLKGRALRYLAQREHSRAELARKLRRFTEEGAGIDAALDELMAHGLLSDERAAASVLISQAPRSGQRRLKQILQTKGLDPELVASTLAQAQGTEPERALALWQRRFGTVAADAAERARQARFLQGRGFGFDVISQVLRRSRLDAAEIEQESEQESEQASKQNSEQP